MGERHIMKVKQHTAGEASERHTLLVYKNYTRRGALLLQSHIKKDIWGCVRLSLSRARLDFKTPFLP